jgi:hypothetical protein
MLGRFVRVMLGTKQRTRKQTVHTMEKKVHRQKNHHTSQGMREVQPLPASSGMAQVPAKGLQQAAALRKKEPFPSVRYNPQGN